MHFLCLESPVTTGIIKMYFNIHGIPLYGTFIPRPFIYSLSFKTFCL